MLARTNTPMVATPGERLARVWAAAARASSRAAPPPIIARRSGLIGPSLRSCGPRGKLPSVVAGQGHCPGLAALQAERDLRAGRCICHTRVGGYGRLAVQRHDLLAGPEARFFRGT